MNTARMIPVPLALLVAGSLPATLLRAQQSPANALVSYQRARQIVEAALQAYGGRGRWEQLHQLTLSFDGRRHMLGGAQSYDPLVETGPIDVQPAKFRLTYDLEHNRFVREQEDHFPADYVYTYRLVLNPARAVLLNLDKTFSGPVADTSVTATMPSSRAQFWREMPALLLLQLERRPASLRYVGQAAEGNVSQDVVTGTDETGTVLTLYFDPASHLLTRSETVRDDPVRGDLVSAISYRDYHDINGLKIHARRSEFRNDLLFNDGVVTVVLDHPAPDSLFGIPQGFAVMSLPALEAEPVRNLGGGVYLAQETPDQNRVLFVAFKDYVLVVEAPSGSAVSEGTIKLIQETLPGKPIRYVTMTHHHQDHAAGLRAYIARGVTVVTTPGNKRFVEQLARAEHSLAPDSLSRAPRALRIETFEGRRVFSDGDQVLELHEMSKNSHVREMLFAYLPKRHMIYQGDPLILPAYGTDVPPALSLTREFATELKRLRLQVDTILNTHGRLGTLKDLNASLADQSAIR